MLCLPALCCVVLCLADLAACVKPSRVELS